MPIENYKRRANLIEQRLLNSPEISEHNKRVLQRFLISYDVSDARRLIFLDKIQKILLQFPIIEEALTARDRMNAHFAQLRRQYSPSTYATYFHIAKRFLSWLNDGERVSSMRDLKAKSKTALRRDLKPEDMITWEDGQKIADASCNIQIAAIASTQLDCGFRPSEFVDLNYGDVMRQTGLAVFSVREGKTGSRHVVAHRCLPALFKWLDAHPTKRAGDPLWISEKATFSSGGQIQVIRYTYSAMKKRVRQLAEKAGIRKPMDFYNLRHSSCVLDKMDNLPVDLAAERHGHSVKHFVGTYGRLSIQDVMKRFQSHYGTEGEEEAQKPMQHHSCQLCQTLNQDGANWCTKCGTPFNTKGAVEVASQHGFGKHTSPIEMKDELTRMREELANSRQREEMFRQEQLTMLSQMNEIRKAIKQQTSQPKELITPELPL